jgi:threonyl-tRNA synthetase
MTEHRQLGRELGLFGSDPLIGAGLPYCCPPERPSGTR